MAKKLLRLRRLCGSCLKQGGAFTARKLHGLATGSPPPVQLSTPRADATCTVAVLPRHRPLVLRPPLRPPVSSFVFVLFSASALRPCRHRAALPPTSALRDWCGSVSSIEASEFDGAGINSFVKACHHCLNFGRRSCREPRPAATTEPPTDASERPPAKRFSPASRTSSASASGNVMQCGLFKLVQVVAGSERMVSPKQMVSILESVLLGSSPPTAAQRAPKASDRSQVQSKSVRLPDSPPISLDDHDVHIALKLSDDLHLNEVDCVRLLVSANQEWGLMGREPLEIYRLAAGLWYTERRDLITSLHLLLRAAVLDQGLEDDILVEFQKYLEELINSGLRQRLISLIKAFPHVKLVYMGAEFCQCHFTRASGELVLEPISLAP
ncbi:hypothetical protein PIB30_056008 [Stylosanthes scabra]|uniref:Uncharacterized protein n=1 Tax=Stylosanthes scabra TaxID=79078 RepID=A0ABU6RJB6_9FABA|nr:hypothetical protein [Stylosanthes scabra]